MPQLFVETTRFSGMHVLELYRVGHEPIPGETDVFASIMNQSDRPHE